MKRPEFQGLPVVVLTSSANESDMEKARELDAREYLVKPNDFRKLTKMLQEAAARRLGEGETATGAVAKHGGLGVGRQRRIWASA